MKTIQILTTLYFEDHEPHEEVEFDFQSLGHSIGDAIIDQDIDGLTASACEELSYPATPSEFAEAVLTALDLAPLHHAHALAFLTGVLERAAITHNLVSRSYVNPAETAAWDAGKATAERLLKLED